MPASLFIQTVILSLFELVVFDLNYICYVIHVLTLNWRVLKDSGGVFALFCLWIVAMLCENKHVTVPWFLTLFFWCARHGPTILRLAGAGPADCCLSCWWSYHGLKLWLCLTPLFIRFQQHIWSFCCIWKSKYGKKYKPAKKALIQTTIKSTWKFKNTHLKSA